MLGRYASVTRGFRPGGPNFVPVPEDLCAESLAAIGLDSVPAAYESDALWSYETGARASWLDDRLRLSVAAYHVDWTDVQILGFLTCGTGFVQNAGEARSDGAELELSVEAGDDWELSLNAAYIDAHLTRDIPSLSIRAGDVMPGAPRWSASGSLVRGFRPSSRLQAFIRADVRYVGETFGSFVPEGAPRLRAPAHDQVDLRVGLSGSRWSGQVFVANALDEYGIVSTVDDFGLHPGGDWHNVVTPRTIGFTLSIRIQ